MRHYPEGEPIRVRSRGDGQPLAFAWRGETHRIESVEDVREPRLDWWAPTGEIHRIYWLVITHRGLVCEIWRDMADNSWCLGRRWD
jgi:hypothetical protein